MEEILAEINQQSLELKKALIILEKLEERISSRNFGGSSDVIFKHLIYKPEPNIKIKMYKEHHGEPHVHIDINRSNHDASVSIKDQRVLAGSMDRKYEKLVLPWIGKNSDKLLTIWNDMQVGNTIDLSKLN